MTELDPRNFGKGPRPYTTDEARAWFASLSRDEALVYRALYHAVACGGFNLFGFGEEPEICGTVHSPKFVRALIDAVDSARKPLDRVVPTFGEQNATIYSPNDWFGSWPEKVRATVSATDFERHMLWEQWSLEAHQRGKAGNNPRPSVRWRQRNPGTSALLNGERFSTNVSLVVEEIEGHLVLFWEPVSQLCDHELAEDWVRRSFPNAVEHTNAMNFHNAVHALGRIK